MTIEQRKVREFMKKFEQFIGNKPRFPDARVQTLRVRLIREEWEEFVDAMVKKNLVEVADALGDLLYVIYGTGVAFGIDLEPIFSAIHRANMAKEGGVHRKDGKWVKPDNWKPPDIAGLLKEQYLKG